ncbi:MAG: NADP-dependent oxidoreductase [Motiliproteus sp.]
MKAVRLHEFGGPEVLQIEETSNVTLQPGQVRIKTSAAGVNPIDWKTREGGGAAGFIGELPVTLGWECAGEVIEVYGDEATLKVGDKVAGLLNFPAAGNCYAEQIVAPAKQLAICPECLDPVAAGGLPLTGLTAWQALFEGANLQPGQRVLILAASGGVGHLAVQLAKWKGAWVAGTASASNRDYLLELGCDQVIDYHQEAAGRTVSDIDVIIDAVGGETAIEALACLNKTGTVITLPSNTAAAVIAAAEQRGVKAQGIRVRSDASQLSELVQLMDKGRLKLHLDRSFPLQQVAQAHQHSQSGRARGKIVLTF